MAGHATPVTVPSGHMGQTPCTTVTARRVRPEEACLNVIKIAEEIQVLALLDNILGLTSEFLVMNLRVLQAPARLTSPFHPFAGLLDKAARTIRGPVVGVVASV